MKKCKIFITLVLILILILSFSGCKTKDIDNRALKGIWFAPAKLSSSGELIETELLLKSKTYYKFAEDYSIAYIQEKEGDGSPVKVYNVFCTIKAKEEYYKIYLIYEDENGISEQHFNIFHVGYMGLGARGEREINSKNEKVLFRFNYCIVKY